MKTFKYVLMASKSNGKGEQSVSTHKKMSAAEKAKKSNEKQVNGRFPNMRFWIEELQ